MPSPGNYFCMSLKWWTEHNCASSLVFTMLSLPYLCLLVSVYHAHIKYIHTCWHPQMNTMKALAVRRQLFFNCKYVGRDIGCLHLQGEETWIQGFHFEKQNIHYALWLPARQENHSCPSLLLISVSPIQPFDWEDSKACLTSNLYCRRPFLTAADLLESVCVCVCRLVPDSILIWCGNQHFWCIRAPD